MLSPSPPACALALTALPGIKQDRSKHARRKPWVKCLPTRSMPLKGLISGSCPSAREFVPRFLRTRPYGRRPCVSLAVCLHQARQGTLAPKLLIMLGPQKKTARKGGLEGELSENYKFIL